MIKYVELLFTRYYAKSYFLQSKSKSIQGHKYAMKKALEIDRMRRAIQ